MTELRDLSRLPVDESYWEGLEARIVGELGPRVRQGVVTRPGWWTPLVEHAWAFGGLAAAAMLALVLVMPERTYTASPIAEMLLRPDDADPALVDFIAAPAPPRLAALVFPAQESSR
jgi:hypothetical protein